MPAVMKQAMVPSSTSHQYSSHSCRSATRKKLQAASTTAV